MIVGEDSMIHLTGGSNVMARPLVYEARAAFGRSGAPYGQYMLSDAIVGDLPAKLQVFLAAWSLTPDQRRQLRDNRGCRRDPSVVLCPRLPDERVLLFWLVRRDGVWRINKSDKESRRVVDERLRGFLEAGDVRWYVQRGQLLGRWEAGPCRPPIIGGVACGSRLELGDDNRYRLAAWGPGGPLTCSSGDVFEGDDVMHGVWRLTTDRILMSHQGQTHECRVVWLADNLLVVQSPDGTDRATYERHDTISVSDEGK